MSSPHNKEVIAIYVPRLHGVLIIFEYDFDVISEIGSHYRCLEVATPESGVIRDASHTEHSGELVEVGHFQRSVTRNEGNTIHSVSLFAIDDGSRVGEPYCSAYRNQSIVV